MSFPPSLSLSFIKHTLSLSLFSIRYILYSSAVCDYVFLLLLSPAPESLPFAYFITMTLMVIYSWMFSVCAERFGTVVVASETPSVVVAAFAFGRLRSVRLVQ